MNDFETNPVGTMKNMFIRADELIDRDDVWRAWEVRALRKTDADDAWQGYMEGL